MKHEELLERLVRIESKGELTELIQAFQESIPQDIYAEVTARAEKKQVFERYQEFSEILTDLVNNTYPLVDEDTYEGRYRQYLQLVRHAENIWDDAVFLFRRESYPTALALAIVSLEEIGKISATRFHVVMSREALEQVRKRASCRRRGGNPFFQHKKKHLLAAGSGALINARLERIMGVEHVLSFLEKVEQGTIENLRQTALYADINEDALNLPQNVISCETATRYLVLAGECLGEVLGFEPGEWCRLIDKVRAFEESVGLSSD